MANKSTKNKGNNDAMVAAEIGAGLLAAAGAAAAGYFFYASSDAPKNRKKTAKWAGEMKDKVIKEAKKEMKVAAKLDKKAIALIVDRAAKAYQGVRSVKPQDLMLAANELKQNWKEIEAELSAAGKKAESAAKKSSAAVKKAAKTATKSATSAVKKAASTKKVAKKK